ncbi:ribosomal protein L14E/L6E/L27E [Desulfofundulus luciae]|uniref:Ribosomal protein L14E/L6E/L27E n=1 Tax=Desulfofundulus luciae TaxID=74702 RepID=A0ABU0B3Y3_9FIRM|nr:KOW domain-containing RNA-binding protein [Desulfofundulus luciae]MDQ0286133.1 ribosomal protein L14E/L6E/L27E [Desulfofundulus luciae]
MKDYFTPGRLVSSTAGRDYGKFYLILDRVNETRVRVVNGADRRVGGPKLKNVKHLKVYPLVAGDIAHKASTGQRITDLDVRRALKELLETYGQATPAPGIPSDETLEHS